MIRTIATVLLLCLVSCQPSHQGSSDFKMVLHHQDNRAPVDSLYPFLNSTDHYVQIRAIQALGQMQDTAAVDSLVARLDHRYHDLREETITALGQIGYGATDRNVLSRIQDALSRQFGLESGWQRKRAVLEGLSKCGDSTALPVLHRALKDTSERVLEAACMAAARLAIRRIDVSALTEAIGQLTTRASADVRWKATYALMRIHDKKSANTLLALLKDPDYRVRMDAARGLGAVSLESQDTILPICQNALIESATADPDWRVRVNAVNALGNFKFKADDLQKIYFLIAFEGIRDRNEHVRISAIRSMAKSYSNDITSAQDFLIPFADRFLPATTPRERGEILVTLARMFGASILAETAVSSVAEKALVHPDGYLRAQTAAALGESKSEMAIPLLQRALTDTFDLVLYNAAEALGAIGGPGARGLLLGALQTTDPVKLLICAGVLAADTSTRITRQSRDELTERIVNSFHSIQGPMDGDVKTGLFDALGEIRSEKAVAFLEQFLSDSLPAVARSAAVNLKRITGRDYQQKIRSRAPLHDIDFEYFVKVKEHHPSATIETDRGSIEIDFLSDDAPLTVVNFLKLAERGYFDGIRFHRVVPNFVIQSGDPTGTGWGGPGYAIRSELNDLTFDRGMVGMASSGKDTEGSQWFITHSPQPHLDGRYTIFAKVISGMEVVDSIQISDRIRSVRITWY